MQKPDEKLLAEVKELSVAERTYLAAYLDILATGEDDKPKRGRPRKIMCRCGHPKNFHEQSGCNGARGSSACGCAKFEAKPEQEEIFNG